MVPCSRCPVIMHVMNDAVESEIIHPQLDVYLNYRHHNLNEYKFWIERIPTAPVEVPPISDDIPKETAELPFCDKGELQFLEIAEMLKLNWLTNNLWNVSKSVLHTCIGCHH